jgi:predicted acylesterase/phospholipase RssA
VTPFVLDHGSLAKAMQASMSIPGALKPVDWDGRILADGTVNNMPVDVAKAMGADVVIAVDISAKLRTGVPQVGIGHDRSAHHLHDRWGPKSRRRCWAPGTSC